MKNRSLGLVLALTASCTPVLTTQNPSLNLTVPTPAASASSATAEKVKATLTPSAPISSSSNFPTKNITERPANERELYNRFINCAGNMNAARGYNDTLTDLSQEEILPKGPISCQIIQQLQKLFTEVQESCNQVKTPIQFNEDNTKIIESIVKKSQASSLDAGQTLQEIKARERHCFPTSK